MNNYYAEKLSAERLRRCYEIAPQRVKQYLEAELTFVLDRISPSNLVLELGCGYGRLIPALAKQGGTILFSSYSDKFWKYCLEWFKRQSEEGLVGEIDFDKTRDGVIVCKDGFTASTVGRERFVELTAGF